MVVGYLLFFTSSIQAISQVGRLVGRGAILSMVLVLSLLPALLSTFDKQIQKQQARAVKKREQKAVRKAEKTRKKGQTEKMEPPEAQAGAAETEEVPEKGEEQHEEN